MAGEPPAGVDVARGVLLGVGDADGAQLGSLVVHPYGWVLGLLDRVLDRDEQLLGAAVGVGLGIPGLERLLDRLDRSGLDRPQVAAHVPSVGRLETRAP